MIPWRWAACDRPGEVPTISRGRRRVRPGRAVEPVGEAAAVDELQREERQAVVLADLVDLTMSGCCSRATASASAWKRASGSGAACGAGQDHLEGDDRGSRPSCRAL